MTMLSGLKGLPILVKMVCDKGEQVCQMALLIKDHKKWLCGSSGPIPSRRVISGNKGLNCHLWEIVAKLSQSPSFRLRWLYFQLLLPPIRTSLNLASDNITAKSKVAYRVFVFKSKVAYQVFVFKVQNYLF